MAIQHLDFAGCRYRGHTEFNISGSQLALFRLNSVVERSACDRGPSPFEEIGFEKLGSPELRIVLLQSR